jgi:hypothetical protein
MNGIFISYRREDSAGHAGRLFDRLRAHFGKGSVFMDVEGIEAGVDFVETIEQAVGGCDALLAVIGRGWLESRDHEGRRRLDDPQDFIRLETGAALARKVRVIPVLVEGAQMPLAESLPTELQALSRRQAVELRDSRWEDDIHALIGVLERVMKSSPDVPASASAKQDDRRDVVAWAWKGGAAALLLGVGVIAYQMWPHERDAPPQPLTMTKTQPVAVLKPDTPTMAAPQPKAMEKPATPTPAPLKPATPTPAPLKPAQEKPIVAKPAIPESSARTAAVQPAPVPPVPVSPEATVLQPQPKAEIAKVAPAPAPAALRKLAVIALGEPTYRSFWGGERRATYSAKVARVYRDALREVASGSAELTISTDSERDIRGLEKALRETPRLCDSTRAAAVFVARVEEPQTISSVESAYWPELRLTAIACESGKQYNARDILVPRRDDGFPFERHMAESMEKFAREYRHLLQ